MITAMHSMFVLWYQAMTGINSVTMAAFEQFTGRRVP